MLKEEKIDKLSARLKFFKLKQIQTDIQIDTAQATI